jgi:iron complex transport system substrate-binding protein
MKNLLFLLCYCLALLGSTCLAQTKPERIVSMSLCSDELVLALARPEYVLSISYLSADASYSAHSGEIPTGVTLNRGRAEEVIALEPDMILSTQFSATNATNLLKSLNYPVNVLGFPSDLDASYRQIREVAALLYEHERGEQLIAEMQASLQEIQNSLRSLQGKSAIFYSNNGFSFGRGTLRDHFLSSLQLRNLASEQGLYSVGKFPLELLIQSRPDFLLVDAAAAYDDQLASPLLKHPVINQLFSADQVIVLPDRLFQCAGPSYLKAYSRMLNALGSAP